SRFPDGGAPRAKRRRIICDLAPRPLRPPARLSAAKEKLLAATPPTSLWSESDSQLPESVDAPPPRGIEAGNQYSRTAPARRDKGAVTHDLRRHRRLH